VWKRGLIQLLIMPLPWTLRRRLLRALFGYELDPTAWIGRSIILPNEGLVMRAGSSIGHLNFAHGMDRITLGPGASIGNLNRLYSIPSGHPSLSHEPGRQPELLLDENASIVSRHTFDCSNTIHLHKGTIVAGNHTQVVTHGFSTGQSFHLYTRSITFGMYSLVGTGCIVLGGAHLPPYSALGAGSTLRSNFSETHGVYSGVPATRVADIPEDSPFFTRAGPHPMSYMQL
jgi:serine acetyltransferase